jgi:hypothetical protein
MRTKNLAVSDSTVDITSGCFPLLPEGLLSWWDYNIQNCSGSSSKRELNYYGKTCSFGPGDVNNSVIYCIYSHHKGLQSQHCISSHDKTLDDFQHEEILGLTVEQDTSALTHEVRESLAELKTTILGFRKGFALPQCSKKAAYYEGLMP